MNIISGRAGSSPRNYYGKAEKPVGALAVKRNFKFNLLRRFWLSQDDATLAKLVIRGDLHAEEELITRHYKIVYQIALGIIGEHHGALDVAQGLFARFRKILRNYDGRSALGSYIYRAGVNASLDELRKRKRRGETAEISEVQPINKTDMKNPLEAAEVIRKAIIELPERQRAAVVLKDIQELETEEAASILGITPSGFRTLLAEGRLKLKNVIMKKYPEFLDWSD